MRQLDDDFAAMAAAGVTSRLGAGRRSTKATYPRRVLIPATEEADVAWVGFHTVA